MVRGMNGAVGEDSILGDPVKSLVTLLLPLTLTLW